MPVREPFFSVVTPTFNRGQFLGKAIESVQAQTISDYEHIIVDDGSVDNTEELVKEYSLADSRIIYIKQKNRGRSIARNIGMKRAQGDYVCFLDSDDFWRSNHLAAIKVSIGLNAPPSLYVTQLTWWRETLGIEETVVYADRAQFKSDVEYVIANEFAPDCVAISRLIYLKYAFNPELYINEDLELWARIAAKYPVKTVNQNTAVLRVHSGNTNSTEKDYINPRINVFKLQMRTPEVLAGLSDGFIRNRKQSLNELLIRHLESIESRWLFILQSLLFVVKYPSQPGNAAKLVSILYSLPGGSILKRLIQSSKSSN
ncbi:MAG: glycosyltransferase involved in cell wall biosynthesis [Bacteroidia bacterium]|jgi:glycosyltransferase involved in cell wall biosynthesis